MITKIRTNIFPTKTELKKLRALSGKTGAPVGVLVRRAVDEYLKRLEGWGRVNEKDCIRFVSHGVVEWMRSYESIPTQLDGK